MNVGAAADTFTVSIVPGTGLSPAPAGTTLQIPAGGSQSVACALWPAPPAAGESQGYVRTRGARAGVDLLVPYWYAVPDQTPFDIPVLSNPGTARASLQRIGFRVIDRSLSTSFHGLFPR